MIELTVLNARQHFQIQLKSDRFSIGSEESTDDKNRVIIQDEFFAAQQCTIELVKGDKVGEDRISLTNFGRSLVLSTGARLHHGVVEEIALPITFSAGDTHIQIASSSKTHEIDESITELPLFGLLCSKEGIIEKQIENSPNPETLTSWFDALARIQRSAVGSDRFFELANQVIFNPGGLDGSIVFKKTEAGWESIARHIPYPDCGIDYRVDLIERASESKKVLFHDTSRLSDESKVYDEHAAIVCPVSNDDGETNVVLYGFRCHNRKNNRVCIRSHEAQFVRLIADSISAGLVRMESEADLARKRVLLQQAFSPKVVSELESNPEFLKGQDREVSVLFADLRGFSKVSESIGARMTYQLLTDVMDRFCNAIAEHDGIVIDFFGDGISAFWNAPVDQPDHAILACKAAKAIQASMRDINESWSADLGQRLRVGVGVHTGMAQVGNSGSRNRLKYGPQGNTVNVAARLESATKKVNGDILVSGKTALKVMDEFVHQRICRAQLPGTNSATNLVRLITPETYTRNAQYFRKYQEALELFETGKFTESTLMLTELQIEHDADRYIEFLLKESMRQQGPAGDDSQIESDDSQRGKSDFVVLTQAEDQTKDQPKERNNSNVNSPEECPSEN